MSDKTSDNSTDKSITQLLERIVKRLEEETTALEDDYGDLVECIPKDIAIEIVKEEGGINAD